MLVYRWIQRTSCSNNIQLPCESVHMFALQKHPFLLNPRLIVQGYHQCFLLKTTCFFLAYGFGSRNTLPLGNLLHNYGLEHHAINGKTTTISTAIFNSYVTVITGWSETNCISWGNLINLISGWKPWTTDV